MIILLLCSCEQSIKGTPTDLLSQEFKYVNSVNLLVTASQTQQCDEVLINEKKFSICFTNESKTDVEYIFTNDMTYQTKERVKVGDTYSNVKTKTSEDIVDYEGWGKMLYLPSDWIAVFGYDEEITDSSKVQFLFYRN